MGISIDEIVVDGEYETPMGTKCLVLSHDKEAHTVRYEVQVNEPPYIPRTENEQAFADMVAKKI